MTDETKIAEEVLNNMNKNCVRCQFCFSLILKEQQGEFLEQEFELPLMHQKHTKKANIVDAEMQRYFWLVPDMFIFENIGFSNTVSHYKYLTCADCDMGPVGYHDINSKKCYIALSRVRHGNEPEDIIEHDGDGDVETELEVQ